MAEKNCVEQFCDVVHVHQVPPWIPPLDELWTRPGILQVRCKADCTIIECSSSAGAKALFEEMFTKGAFGADDLAEDTDWDSENLQGLAMEMGSRRPARARKAKK